MIERATVDERVVIDKIGGSHIRIVQPGDTLHAIAFANGLNVNDLAAWNQLEDTSKLRVSHRIRLTRPVAFTPKSKHKKNTRKISDRSGRLAKSNSSKIVDASKQKSVWHWPTQGKVIARFAANLGQQGIDIEGKSGQPVVASSAGEVVYVGNGLKGYGNLVIIKHSEKYLSAYAHNQETFVHEGQKVAASYRIANLGKNKQQRNALHFQIRLNGQPVDPLKYLAIQ